MPSNTSDAKAIKVFKRGIEKLDDNQLACRDMRHAWQVEENYRAIPSQSEGKSRQLIRRTLACSRDCETRRIETYALTRYGLEKIAQSYSYFDGYQIAGAPRGVKPSVIIQQESFRRAMKAAGG